MGAPALALVISSGFALPDRVNPTGGSTRYV